MNAKNPLFLWAVLAATLTPSFARSASDRKPVLAQLMRLLWAAALVLPVFRAQAETVLTTLHSFEVFTNGANPSGLVQGSDGYFYGTTQYGGTYANQQVRGAGTVFMISSNRVLISLHLFTGGDDGACPHAELVPGSDGYFYGTTSVGGTNGVPYGGYGTVFKINTNGALTTLYNFGSITNASGWPLDGANPQGGLVPGSDGYFYGTTGGGGLDGAGTVFKINTNGVLTTLYSFTGGDDGWGGIGLVRGRDGDFYGTTEHGGSNGALGGGYGTVFKISPKGTLTTLYAFGSITNANGEALDGVSPQAGLVQGSDGNLYGTTSGGGSSGVEYGGYGTVFKISTNGALTTLYAFGSITNPSGEVLDGAFPRARLVQGRDGDFYGTTSSLYWGYDHGTMFKISTEGVLTTLYSWGRDADGANPQAALVQGSDGSFYGTTSGLFGHGAGTVFKISSTGAHTTLYSFTGGNDSAYPRTGLVQGSDGSFYGTTLLSGYNMGGGLGGGYYSGRGTVFKISRNGTYTSLYSFTGGNDGGNPNELMQGSDGNFYGTTFDGGTNYSGTVFKISTNGALMTLYSFKGTNDGANPFGALVQGSDDSFCGVTSGGGTNGAGTVFKVSTTGSLKTLHSFNGLNDGWSPCVLIQGSDGDFYGTTGGGNIVGCSAYGTIFKISPTGTLATLYSFTGLADGWGPNGLVRGNDGNFYGRTWGGGTSGFDGTVFKITTDGVLTRLYSFGDLYDIIGVYPPESLMQGRNGDLYGTTYSGGTTNYDLNSGTYGGGTVFKISTNGAYTTLYAFTGGDDGCQPYAGLVQDGDGNFYGTTSKGGRGGAGTVFLLTIVPDSPELSIIPSEPYVILTWPTNAVGYTLQSTTNLGSSSVWTAVSPGPVVINGQNTMTNPISGTQQFFRLSQ